MSIWYPSSGLTWGQYLQAESFAKDVRGSIDTTRSAVRSAISNQTRTLVASNAQLADRFGRAFDQMSGRLEMGLRAIDEGIVSVASAIEAFHADFTYSFSLLVEQLRIQNGLLATLVDRLDAIHNTLRNPTATKAREFYQIGCERLARGLLDKALQALQRAAELNDTDFFIQFQIGKLYLYGIDDDDNVVDLARAKSHLLEAARYAKGEAAIDVSFLRLAAQACLHASIASYASIDDATQNEPRVDLLKEADSLAARALQYDPNLGEAYYHRAKYLALLKDPNATTLLKSAIQLDRDYAVKVDLDAAFEGCRPKVIQLLEKLRDDARARSEEQVRRAQSARQEAWAWKPAGSQALSTRLSEAEQSWMEAQTSLKSGTYFGFLDSLAAAQRVAEQFAEVSSARRTSEEKVLSEAHSHVLSTLSTAGRIAANASLVDRANQLIQRSLAEANHGTLTGFERARELAHEAQLTADAAVKAKLAFDLEQHGRQEKKRRFQQATEAIPKLFLLRPLLWGIASFVVLGLAHFYNVVIAQNGAGPMTSGSNPNWGLFFTLTKFLIGAGIALVLGVVSFFRRL